MSMSADEVRISPAEHILAALKQRSGDCIWASELAFTGGTRRCDFWQLEVHASKGFRATAYEIKVSRADFKRDSAVKQREARLYSDRFYYVAPVGLLKLDEIPEWAGLMEWDGYALRTKLLAPHRDKDAPSWELVVSLIRNSGEIRRETDIVRDQLARVSRLLEASQQREREAWAAANAARQPIPIKRGDHRVSRDDTGATERSAPPPLGSDDSAGNRNGAVTQVRKA